MPSTSTSKRTEPPKTRYGDTDASSRSLQDTFRSKVVLAVHRSRSLKFQISQLMYHHLETRRFQYILTSIITLWVIFGLQQHLLPSCFHRYKADHTEERVPSWWIVIKSLQHPTFLPTRHKKGNQQYRMVLMVRVWYSLNDTQRIQSAFNLLYTGMTLIAFLIIILSILHTQGVVLSWAVTSSPANRP